ncbi:MAG TPA: radical SAM protein [Bacteroidales bacterium]|nr:radical SAM protein [Bacteroidales bacterium]
MAKYSKYNIISQIRNSANYFIVNLLSGNADILDKEEAEKILSIKNGGSADDEFIEELTAKGYLTDEKEEKKKFLQKYLSFLDSRESDEVQLFFITNYSCNFACSYCYQDQYTNAYNELTKEVIDSFYNHIRTEFAGRKKYVTIFGGEPLLPGSKQKDNISYLLEKAASNGLRVCIVTNGYTLKEYSSMFSPELIREIQVTLDGTKEMHDSRRYLKGGGATFDKIVEGIDSCLEKGLPVNLRIVADRENIGNIPELASFAIEKGWTANPLFKTQIGRNYELHHCQSSSGKLFDRISLYEKLSEITKSNPHVLQFHKPAYSITRYLAENGNLPEPLFDSCPACKTEWAYDYTGRIYPCTATVGKEGENLGTYFPEHRLNESNAEEWSSRDVTTIKECTECNLQLACGGGCGSVARNHSGKICSPDCRPVKELMELGFSAYLGQ